MVTRTLGQHRLPGREIRTVNLGMVFRVHHVDHGGNIYATEQIEHEDEQALIEHLRRRHSHAIGAGFDVWQGDRLVYRHRK